jgi:aspartate aminotransferase
MRKLSFVGDNIVGSEIIKISQQIKEVSKTKPVMNFSIGDFNPKINPIPDKLKQYIIESYENDITNYPMSSGELDLRTSVSKYFEKKR